MGHRDDVLGRRPSHTLDGVVARDNVRRAGSESPPVEPDRIVLSVDVSGNGTAQWRIEYRTLLADSATKEAFRAFQRDLQNGSTTGSEQFYGQIRASIRAGENATGREMSGTSFGVDATIRRLPQEYGSVVYRFQWHGFAAVSDGRLSVGDALGGFFLDDDERLVLSWPRGYEQATLRPSPDTRRDRTVVWQGPFEFGPDEPRVLLVERSTFEPWFLWVGAGIALVAFGVFLVRFRRRSSAIPRVMTLVEDPDDESELLSNEERVVELLEQRGGRIKQQDITDEFGWTETKASNVVSTLRENGRIHSFRLGRENVLSLSDPYDVDSRRA